MSRRTARTLTAIFFACFLLAVTWPGMIPFNHARPFVLGLPFSFFWVVLWVVGGGLVLFGLDRVEQRERRDG